MRFETIPPRELQQDVQDLITRHAELIDDDRLEDWPALFVEDCVYKIMPRENADRGMPLATIFCDSRRTISPRVEHGPHHRGRTNADPRADELCRFPDAEQRGNNDLQRMQNAKKMDNGFDRKNERPDLRVLF